jgi:hypothetical protein
MLQSGFSSGFSIRTECTTWQNPWSVSRTAHRKVSVFTVVAPGLAARAFERAHSSCYCGKRLCRLACLQAKIDSDAVWQVQPGAGGGRGRSRLSARPRGHGHACGHGHGSGGPSVRVGIDGRACVLGHLVDRLDGVDGLGLGHHDLDGLLDGLGGVRGDHLHSKTNLENLILGFFLNLVNRHPQFRANLFGPGYQ